MTLDDFLKNDEKGQEVIMMELRTTDPEEVVERWNKLCSVDGTGQEYLLIDGDFYNRLEEIIN